MGRKIRYEEVFYEELGRRVRKARKDLYLTQQQLADQLGVNRTSITNIEKGKQKLLAFMLVELASKLKVTIDDLLPEVRSVPREIKLDNLVKNDDSEEKRKFLKSILDKARGG